MFFYAFDAEQEKKVCAEIFEQSVGSWSVVKELKLTSENIVMFVATVADGSPSALSKDGKKNQTIDKLKIRIIA